MKHRNFIGIGLVVIAILISLLWANIRSSKQPTTTSNTSPSTQTKPAVTEFNKKQYSIADPTSLWVVVNKKRPLNPITYAPSDTTSVGNGQLMRAGAAQALAKMLEGAKTAGYVVTPASGYRSYATQVGVYNNEVKSYGQAVADSESARPGYSEHQTGWGIDLGSGGCNIADCFASTPGGKWVTDNAYKYGFLLRYPTNKTAITGYRNEAWHFRYIGTDLAAEMKKQGVTTLEEFFGLPAAPTY